MKVQLWNKIEVQFFLFFSFNVNHLGIEKLQQSRLTFDLFQFLLHNSLSININIIIIIKVILACISCCKLSGLTKFHDENQKMVGNKRKMKSLMMMEERLKSGLMEYQCHYNFIYISLW